MSVLEYVLDEMRHETKSLPRRLKEIVRDISWANAHLTEDGKGPKTSRSGAGLGAAPVPPRVPTASERANINMMEATSDADLQQLLQQKLWRP